MSLTSYQRAVLQEMGIPVWLSKDAHAVNNTKEGSVFTPVVKQTIVKSPSSTPISKEEKQSRLAQLRAQVGSTNELSQTKPVQKAEENCQPDKQSTRVSSQDQSPKGIPLSAEQKQLCAVWLSDLTLACVQLGLPSSWANNVMIGKSLSISEQAIILPELPSALSSHQKRALWNTLINASKSAV